MQKIFKHNLSSVFDFEQEIFEIEKEENIAPNKIRYLELTQIAPGRYQPRKIFDEQALEELSISIRNNGVLQPILVREIDIHKYEIIAGERRYRATQLLKKKSIPCIIVENVTEEQVMGFSLLENIQRENLDPIEEAEAYYRLLVEFNISHKELSKRLGKKRSTITNILRLNDLNKEVKQLIREKHLSVGHAKLLLSLEDFKQLEAANYILRKNLSVREAEKYLQNKNEPLNKKNKKGRKEISSIHLDEAIEIENMITKDIQPLISSKKLIQNTSINQVGKKVELILSFKDLECLDSFLWSLYKKIT